MKHALISLLVIPLSSQALADTWTVNANGKADFTTIQEAIDAAIDGDELLVMPGTYTSSGNEVVNMKGKSIWLHSSQGANVTIIDGEGERRGILCVFGETSKTIIEGLTITNCYTSVGGGGMFNDNSNPMLDNCIFTNNFAIYGGGITNSNSSPTLTNCTIENNSAIYEGGGIHNYDNSSPSLTNCTFTGNASDSGYGHGGGMYNYEDCSPTLTECIFENNTADFGGGMFNDNTSPTLTDCTFTGNSADDYGGGMGNNSNSNPTLENCTFTGNTAYRGGGMFNNNSSPTLENCTVTGNTAYYGGGMFIANSSHPTLRDTIVCSNTPDQIDGDWINNGGNSVADECPIDCPDINGDGYVDVSDLLTVIDQWGLTTSPADVNEDGTVDVSDLLIVISNWGDCE